MSLHHRQWFYLFSVLLAFAVVSCKQVKVSPDIEQIDLSNIVEKNDQLLLYREKKCFILRHNSRKVEYGGIQIVLPDEVLRDADGVWQLPERSVWLLKTLIEPERAAVKTVVIDPGHGGKDPGALSVSAKAGEKDLNLDLALKLGNALQRYGFKVLYTREDDSTIPLNRRGKMFRADLFISIHHNASKNISASGAETFCLLSSRNADRKKIAPALHIACEIQRAQSAVSGNYGRGVKFANFRVLRDAEVPAILFETGFLTNPDDEKRLLSAAWRQLMAEALAQGISRAVSL